MKKNDEVMASLRGYLELAEKATPGPWDYPAKHGDCYVCFGEIVDSKIQKAVTHQQNEMVLAEPNLQFIAASRTMGPALAKALIRAVQMLESASKWSEDENEFDDTLADIERILGGGEVKTYLVVWRQTFESRLEMEIDASSKEAAVNKVRKLSKKMNSPDDFGAEINESYSVDSDGGDDFYAEEQ